MVQLSQQNITTGKTIALTIQTFVGQMMSLLFHMQSRFVIAFSSKEQASFNFMAVVTICSDFGAQGNKVCHCFHSSQEHNFGERLGPVTYSVGKVLKTHSPNIIKASLVVQMVKNLPIMRETSVRSLSWEDPLEKTKATNSSILAWRIPWTEEPGGLQSMGLQRVGHD